MALYWVHTSAKAAASAKLSLLNARQVKHTHGCRVWLRPHRTVFLQRQNLANAVSELLQTEHGTPYRYISVRQPSADNSSSLGSKLISSNAPTYDFYLRELLRSELTYLLTNSNLMWSGQPPKSNGFFCGPRASFHQILWKSFVSFCITLLTTKLTPTRTQPPWQR